MSFLDSMEQWSKDIGTYDLYEHTTGLRDDRKAIDIRDKGLTAASNEIGAGEKKATDSLDEMLKNVEGTWGRYNQYVQSIQNPYNKVGMDAIDRLDAFLKDPSMVELLPGYKEGLAEAESGLSRRMSASGETFGAATGAEFGRQAQDYQRTKTQEFLAEIRSLIGIGQNAANTMTGAAGQAAGGIATAQGVHGVGAANLAVDTSDKRAGIHQDRAENKAGYYDTRAQITRDSFDEAKQVGTQIAGTAIKLVPGM